MAARRGSGQARNRKRPAPRRRPPPGWVWGLAGLMVGLFVALLVHLEERPSGNGLDRMLDAGRDGPASRQPRSGSDRKSPDDTDNADEPRFEFYKLLREQHVDVPNQDTPDDRTATAKPSPKPAGKPPPSRAPATQSTGGQHYLLQAGSFRRLKDADRLKAELALLGVEAAIERVQLASGETWHRVRIGPYASLAKANDVRDRLQSNDIDTILLKRNG